MAPRKEDCFDRGEQSEVARFELWVVSATSLPARAEGLLVFDSTMSSRTWLQARRDLTRLRNHRRRELDRHFTRHNGRYPRSRTALVMQSDVRSLSRLQRVRDDRVKSRCMRGQTARVMLSDVRSLSRLRRVRDDMALQLIFFKSVKFISLMRLELARTVGRFRRS